LAPSSLTKKTGFITLRPDREAELASADVMTFTDAENVGRGGTFDTDAVVSMPVNGKKLNAEH
jgi:hypothetical protein